MENQSENVSLSVRQGVNTFEEFFLEYNINRDRYLKNGGDYEAIVFNAIFTEENRTWLSNRLQENLDSDSIKATDSSVTSLKIILAKPNNGLTKTDKSVINSSYIPTPIVLNIPFDLIRDFSQIETNTTIFTNENNEQNFRFKESEKLFLRAKNEQKTKVSGVGDDGVFSKIYKKPSVFIWSKVLDKKNTNQFLNVSKFCEVIRKNDGMNASTLNLSLSEMETVYGVNGWEPVFLENDKSYFSKSTTVRQNSSKSTNPLKHNDDAVVVKGKSTQSRDFIQTNLFFDRTISTNDIVFMTFDDEIFDKFESDLFVPSAKLAGLSFDFIGLVDECDANTGVSSATTTISCRDLMKLLIDDGTFFFPNSINENQSSNVFFNESDLKNSREFRRLKVLGFLTGLYDRTKYDLPYLLNFLFSALANIQVCPDSVFNSFKDKTTYTYIEQVDKNNDVVKKTNEVTAAGIWALVKLIVDKDIVKYRPTDFSLQNYQGSLLNYVRKICQTPFVEFFGDTYGDKYYFIARKPIFDLNSIVTSYTIESDEVESDDIKYETEFFSIFNLNPVNSFYQPNVQYNFLTAIFLPEYVETFGSKVYNQTTQYVNDLYDAAQMNVSEYELLLNDLMWVVKTNAYLPFTRRGTITINGKSNLKKGNWLYYKPTQEMFYIDSISTVVVNNSSNTNYSTTIQVSRGMVKKYIVSPYDYKLTKGQYRKNNYDPNDSGITLDKEIISYFNLVNFEFKDKQTVDSDGFIRLKNFKGSTFLDFAKVSVNKKNFDFFLERKQFI